MPLQKLIRPFLPVYTLPPVSSLLCAMAFAAPIPAASTRIHRGTRLLAAPTLDNACLHALAVHALPTRAPTFRTPLIVPRLPTAPLPPFSKAPNPTKPSTPSRTRSAPPIAAPNGSSSDTLKPEPKGTSKKKPSPRAKAKAKSSSTSSNSKPDDSVPTPEESAFLNAQLDARLRDNLKNSATETSAPRKRARTRRSRTSTTPRDTFRAYMVDISREELLDHAQVTKLACQIREGTSVESAQQRLSQKLKRRPSVAELATELSLSPADVQKHRMVGAAAKNALVSANLRLVTSIANRVMRHKSSATPEITIDDMVQEGSVGLIRAAEKFDVSRGYKFSTYATWWIRAYIMRSMTVQGRSIKVPSSLVDEYSRIRKQFTIMQDGGLGRPTDEDVAAELGITTAKLKFVIRVVTHVPASLDMPVHSEDDMRALGDMIKGDDAVEEKMVQEMERKELDAALRKYLRPVERAVIRLRFGLDDGQSRSFRETGELLGLSKERIRQVMFRALPKLRNPEIHKMLEDATTH